jgi:hypothetical protein
MGYLRDYALSKGNRYQDLIPNAEWVTPNKSGPAKGNRGWAFCARTPERDLFMVYFEADCPQASIRSALPDRTYRAQWFDPRTGQWSDAGLLTADQRTYIRLPEQPSSEDWALRLVLA